jgi:hypothetical protein
MAGDLLRFYRDFILSAPDEVCGGVAFITAPPEEFVPEPVRGQPVIGVVVLYVGDPAEGEEAFGPLREFGPPGSTWCSRCRTSRCNSSSIRPTRAAA